MVYIYGNGVLNLSSNSRSRVWIAGYLHRVKKGNMMVMMVDLGWNLFPSTGSFGCLFLFNIMLFSIDVGVVINDYHHLREGGHSSKSYTICL